MWKNIKELLQKIIEGPEPVGATANNTISMPKDNTSEISDEYGKRIDSSLASKLEERVVTAFRTIGRGKGKANNKIIESTEKDGLDRQ